MDKHESELRESIRTSCEGFARVYDLEFMWTPADTLLFKCQIGAATYVTCHHVGRLLEPGSVGTDALHAWWSKTADDLRKSRARDPVAQAQAHADIEMVGKTIGAFIESNRERFEQEGEDVDAMQARLRRIMLEGHRP